MRKFALLGALLGALSLSVPLDISFAGHHKKQHHKKYVVQGKTKKSITTKKSNKTTAQKKKTFTKRKNLKPRYAKNINKPQEGELLKLEGMVRDLNE
ncbi:MAG: hypothetical protein ACK4MW_02895 [Aquificaceae bacterium]